MLPKPVIFSPCPGDAPVLASLSSAVRLSWLCAVSLMPGRFWGQLSASAGPYGEEQGAGQGQAPGREQLHLRQGGREEAPLTMPKSTAPPPSCWAFPRHKPSSRPLVPGPPPPPSPALSNPSSCWAAPAPPSTCRPSPPLPAHLHTAEEQQQAVGSSRGLRVVGTEAGAPNSHLY